MGWVFLIVAGVLEVGWVISLKYTHGFTRLVPIVFYAVFGAGSAYFLSLSMKTLPLAPAYTIWAGIGAIGAAAYGAMYLDEPLRALRVASMLLILVGIVGLKLSASAPAS